jgi:hypothetical protein
LVDVSGYQELNWISSVLLLLRDEAGTEAAVQILWDSPPSAHQACGELRKHLNQRIEELGDVEVGGLPQAELRQRIVARILNGKAPRASTEISRGIVIHSGIGVVCDACGDEGADMELPREGFPSTRFHSRCMTIHAEEVLRHWRQFDGE